MNHTLDEIQAAIVDYAARTKEHNRIKNSMAANRLPYEPPAQIAMPDYSRLAKFLNIDVSELSVILSHAIAHPSEITRGALEHLVMIGKINGADQLAEHRAKRREVMDRYHSEMDRYNRRKEEIAQTQAKLDEFDAIPKLPLKDLWASFVTHLHDVAEEHGNRIYLMQPQDRELFGVMSRGSRFVNLAEPGTVEVNWDEVKHFKPDHIRFMIQQFIAVMEQNSKVNLTNSMFDLR